MFRAADVCLRNTFILILRLSFYIISPVFFASWMKQSIEIIFNRDGWIHIAFVRNVLGLKLKLKIWICENFAVCNFFITFVQFDFSTNVQNVWRRICIKKSDLRKTYIFVNLFWWLCSLRYIFFLKFISIALSPIFQIHFIPSSHRTAIVILVKGKWPFYIDSFS